MSARVQHGGGRPTRYQLKDGTVVPGVTTIVGKFKDPGALMFWAWKQGCEGKDFRQSRDDAAEIGHIAHGWIDDWIHGKGDPPEPQDDRTRAAYAGYEAFRDWRQMVNLEIVDTERPLVSELHRYGGTYDALALLRPQSGSSPVPILLDWKTGNGVYTEHIAQLAAYRQLIRESMRDRSLAPARAVLLRVGKEFGDFHFHSFPEEVLDAGWERFCASKWLFETDAILKKAV